MKKLVAAAAIVLALTATAAFAEPEQKPSEPPPQSPNWSGYHVGLDAGYAWDPDIYTAAYPVFGGIENLQVNVFGGFYNGLTHGGASALSATGMVRPNVGGFIGGGQVGYDHQFSGRFIAGVEADFQGAAVRGRQGFLGAATTSTFFDGFSCLLGCTDTVASFVNYEKSIDWLGTVRGRFGYLATPALLVYATGGLAYGGVTAHNAIVQRWGCCEYGPAIQSPGSVGHFSDTRVGWTVGGGLEWLFSSRWSAKVEYLYYDLGEVQFTSGPLLSILPATINNPTVFDAIVPTTRTRFYGDMVRAGVNYRFDLFDAALPSVARILTP